MARIVLTTLGSLGDLLPFVAVAKGLRQKGHAAVIAATPAFGELVRAEGVEFRPVGPTLGNAEYAAAPEIFDSGLNGLRGIQNLMQRFLLPNLRQVYLELRSAVAGADLLVTHPAQMAAPMVVDATGLPWATLTVFPGNIPSRYSVPQGNPIPALPTPLGRLNNQLAWKFSLAIMRRLFDGPINEIRRQCGVPLGRDLFLLAGLSPELCVVASSPHYTPPHPDWPASIRMVGFTLFDQPAAWQGPSVARDFLERGEPPVVFTLGGSLSMDPEAFFEVARDAARKLGRRALFLTGRPLGAGRQSHSPEGHMADSDLCMVPYAPLSLVLPRAAALVHHGGIGTTAAALKHGVPTVVVPRAFDQMFHADRVRALRVGCVVPWRRLSGKRLARGLDRVLASKSFALQSAAVGQAIANEDGPRDSVEMIDAMARSS